MRIVGIAGKKPKEPLYVGDLPHGTFFEATGYPDRVWMRTDTKWCDNSAVEVTGTDALTNPPSKHLTVRVLKLNELVVEEQRNAF